LKINTKQEKPVNKPFDRADRISSIEVSEIVQLSETAASLKQQGQDIVSLSTGEPDFPTPDHIISAANQAALSGKTRYTATVGEYGLRQAVADKHYADLDQVIISTGAKQVLANAMLATLNPNDEVIIPAPYWTSYIDIVKLANGTPVVVNCHEKDNFKLTADQLEESITSKTRWLMLNAPSNPSGAIYSLAEIKALADVLQRHEHIAILSDEIYEHLSYQPFNSCLDVFKQYAPKLVNRTLIVNGVSKAYSMTGWRIGWGVGNPQLIKAMTVVQGQITSGACSISQAAALAALNGNQDFLGLRLNQLQSRRDKVVHSLNQIDSIQCPKPDGAFYVFPDISDACKKVGAQNDAEFCHQLLKSTGVAIVPGRAFGMAGHARISFAYAQNQIDKAIERISDFLSH
jgi:aspartate aminotransferase